MKNIIGWEGKYLIDENGNVWSNYTNKFLKWCEDGDGYASVTLRKNGKQFCARIHQIVATNFLGRKPNECVDHIDRNKKNNCVSNLRICTNSQNQMNTVKWKNNKSGFKGVSKSGNRWVAMIKVKGITNGLEYLGSFLKPEDAARAYDAAAKLYCGVFNRPNFT